MTTIKTTAGAVTVDGMAYRADHLKQVKAADIKPGDGIASDYTRQVTAVERIGRKIRLHFDRSYFDVPPQRLFMVVAGG